MSEFSKTHEIEESEYKGHPTISIPISEDQNGKVFYMSMGLKKAKRILEYADEIRAWIKRAEK